MNSELHNDLKCVSIMKANRPNIDTLVDVLNLVHKKRLGDDFNISDICVIVEESHLDDEVFHVGDIIICYTDSMNNEYKGCVTIIDGQITTYLFTEDRKFIIPWCVWKACDTRINKSTAIEYLRAAELELRKPKNSEEATWYSYVANLLYDEFQKSDYSIDNVRKQETLSDAIQKEKERAVKTVQIPMKDITDGKTKKIDYKMFLN